MKTCFNHLLLLGNPNNNEAFEDVLMNIEGIGKITLEKIKQFIEE